MTGPDDPAWRWEFRAEDFVYARLAEQQTAAEQLPPGPEREQALSNVDSIYLIASQHNIWVNNRGQSAGSCITCAPSAGGVPCYTMRGLARLWNQHPDYRPGWNEHIDRPESGSGATYREYKQRSTIYTRRKAKLDAFYDRFDLVEENGAEFWRCLTCGAEGDRWTDRISIQTATAIGTAAHRHPACPERTSTQ